MISLALILCACVAVWLIWPLLQRRLDLPGPSTAYRRLVRRGRGYRRRGRS